MEDQERLLTDEEQEEEKKGEGELETGPSKRSSWRRLLNGKFLLEQVFPVLTTTTNNVKLSYKRSFVITLTLYTSHILSAWGDRMWMFAVSLFLAQVYPDSLLLPAIYGFITSLSVAIFGTVVGDMVDAYPRMRVIWLSLLVQNVMVALSAVILALMFYMNWSVCNNVPAFAVLTVATTVFGSVAKLATLVNTISVEKDWVVVIANKGSDTLAVLNANMRRIDLACKLLAPIVAGVMLSFVGGFGTTVFIAGWNVVSFVGELGLLWAVYRMVPSLAIKKLRKGTFVVVDGEEKDDKEKENGEVEVAVKKPRLGFVHYLSKLATPYRTLKNGFRIFIRQEIALVGFALATIYLTVLGFSGVTSTYFLTQGLDSGLIGLFYGLGGVIGICGTILYPFLRNFVGTVRAGLVGFSLQFTMLLFCLVAVFAPGVPTTGSDTGYYSPNCSTSNNDTGDDVFPSPTLSYSSPFSSPVLVFKRALQNNSVQNFTSLSLEATTTDALTTSNLFTTLYLTNSSSRPSTAVSKSSVYSTSVSLSSSSDSVSTVHSTASSSPFSTSTSAFLIYSTSSNAVSPSIFTRTSSVYSTSPNAVSPSIFTTSVYSTSPNAVSPSIFTTSVYSTSPNAVSPSIFTTSVYSTSPNAVSPSIFTTSVYSTSPNAVSPSIFTTASSVYSASPMPSIEPSPFVAPSSSVSLSLVFMLIGVMGARFGLWMFDLTVWQLVQEKVKEEERGVVSGVMNAMNSNMDFLHYLLVIAAPRPEHFRWLALLSVVMIGLGWVLYACYVRKARGHFFHFSKLRKLFSKKKNTRRIQQPQLTFINTMADVQDDEEDIEEDEHYK